MAEQIATAAILKADKLPNSHVVGADGAGAALVRSCSDPTVQYTVTNDACSCTHAVRGNLCKHRVKMLLLRYDIKPGQLKTILGTRLGTAAGGLEALRRQHPLRRRVSSR